MTCAYCHGYVYLDDDVLRCLLCGRPAHVTEPLPIPPPSRHKPMRAGKEL